MGRLFKLKEKDKELIKNSCFKYNHKLGAQNILIDVEAIYKLHGEIKDILLEELKLGNIIVEAADCNWPEENSIIVILSEPFKGQIRQNCTEVIYRFINDTHFWKAEYYNKNDRMYLCCRFGNNFKK